MAATVSRVVINNVGNNKIDYYLTGEAAYSVKTDQASGQVTATLDITLHNNAPAGVAEPAIVFGNSEGAPPGTNVMQLNLYSAMSVTGIVVNSTARGPMPPRPRMAFKCRGWTSSWRRSRRRRSTCNSPDSWT